MLKHWILAARPKTLWAGICPVIIGTVLAAGNGFFHWQSALAALAAALLIQIGTNFANDYFDFMKGADTKDRLGPVRATQAGLISPQAMKTAFIVTFVFAFLIGLYLIIRGGWPIVMIGLCSILCGILYTGGPFPLGYNGLGDLFVFVFFGPVAVGGTYYVQALSLSNDVLVASLAPGLFSTAILAVNNLRDMEEDRKTGKRTLAVRFGQRFARREYLFCVLFGSFIPLFIYATSQIRPWSMLTVLVFIAALPVIRTVYFAEGRILNTALARTGLLLLLYTLLFSVGWLISI